MQDVVDDVDVSQVQARIFQSLGEDDKGDVVVALRNRSFEK